MLARVALTLPLSTAWPERGFSAMGRVKTMARNRLLDVTLSALLNVSLNGPQQLPDEAALAIADKWLSRKTRRAITQKKMDDVGTINLDDGSGSESDEADNMDRDRFII